jgi:hypothetical protein
VVVMKSSVFGDITLCRLLNWLNRIEDRGDMFIQNTGLLSADCKALFLRW